MIAARSISLRLCFLSLSCVTALIYSEVAQLEAMMMSNEQMIAQRHDRALTSTSDQMSTSSEERGASVTVEEEAGILSRFVSHFKPSYLWKKLASSWIMRFFRPHIYLRHSSDKVAAGNKLFLKVRADVATDLFSSPQFQKWSKYFTDAFPDNPDQGASIMVLTLVKHHEKKLVEAIPNTKVVNDKLAFGDHFKLALIRYIANAKNNAKSMPVADRLEESLVSLITRLKADDSSKSIGELVERDVRDILQSMLSSHQEVLGWPISPFAPPKDDDEAKVVKLLKDVGLDKVETDIFNSNEFKQWSKQVAESFPSRRDLGAGLMLETLSKVDQEKLLASIPTASVVDGKFAFGDHFKDALMKYIAVSADVNDVGGFAHNLEESLVGLINNLKRGETSWIGEVLEGEFLFVQLNKNKKGLFDIFVHPSVKNWYAFLCSKGNEHALSVLDIRLKQQGITSKQIGEVIRNSPDDFTKDVINKLIVYKLQLLLKTLTLGKAASGEVLRFETWLREATTIGAEVTNVLPLLRSLFSDKQIILLCSSPDLHGDDLKAYAEIIENAIIVSWKPGLSNELLATLGLDSFSLDDPMARCWMKYMTHQYRENANSEMAKVLRSQV
ncbi:uncharacterized protein PHALS_01963 [Plasmopara halstedii]|uniref:RxLR-like protein n=1 Tax=Plasmopara halstedii TaxID=4781 RepID=A0A0P1ATK4_PLAHL|nr:uncharacterized protein PHALS_01963 [Plasmopara halstedii]CEG45680.1 hypothetical protein PHALS_01963 [Plasmopara halstedii]|eukprot:XP_024582049.1 hypothetical protein PHALS_01963 [Plasmopara halstedii]